MHHNGQNVKAKKAEQGRSLATSKCVCVCVSVCVCVDDIIVNDHFQGILQKRGEKAGQNRWRGWIMQV